MDKTVSRAPTKPLLIYDGDCEFCMYWANYWHKLTGDKVEYKPYQSVTEQFPDITQEEFRQAVQYVAPDGMVASAAEASFRTLSHATGKGFWLWLYRWLPGFAFIAEKMYAFIAAHRNGFYWWSLRLWGRHYEPPRFELISWFILRGVGILFLIVFFSFGTQALGLIGSDGITPVSQLVQLAHEKLGSERYWLLPMVFWLNASDWAIQATCLSGLLVSLLLIFNILPRVSLLILYALYLSVLYAGQVFMSFQWDMLVIEISMITFFLAGFTSLGVWLLRWLVFRFIFASGMVKIMSGDPTWQDFTALYYHFFTQPLPTPIAWYVNQLPHFILKFSTASALFVELFTPFLIFFPRRLRFVGASSILVMQTLILLTGNYNFFNISVIIICFALFDDAALRKIIPQRLKEFVLKRAPETKPNKMFVGCAYLFALITVYSSIIQFHQRFYGDVPESLAWLPHKIAPLQIVNTYGPFAVMTTKRMEIIIEGSNDGINWETYAFKYKPGDIYRPPLWNMPFQPRLDWQMWFAALSAPEYNPWFVNFLQRLLEGSPNVLALLEKNPFPDKPPYYVRAQFYDYQFTDSKEKSVSGAWWKRELVGVYFQEAHL